MQKRIFYYDNRNVDSLFKNKLTKSASKFIWNVSPFHPSSTKLEEHTSNLTLPNQIFVQVCLDESLCFLKERMTKKEKGYSEDVVINVNYHNEGSTEIHHGTEDHSDVDVNIIDQNEQNSEIKHKQKETEHTDEVHAIGDDRNINYTETTYAEDAALDAVSGVTLGSLCTYVHTFGTPHQKEKVNEMRKMMFDFEEQEDKDATSKKILENGDSVPQVDWRKYRQQLYDVSGDWLWLHATNHWRTKVSPQMNIPERLLEMALLVDKSTSNYTDITNENSDGGALQNKDNYNYDCKAIPRQRLIKSSYLRYQEFDQDSYSIYFENNDDKLGDKRKKNK